VGELIVHMYVTLDGVVQAPGEPDEDRDGGFDHGGWQAPLLDDESARLMVEHYEAMDALLLGRKTYEIFAGYWPFASPENPFTPLINRAPKYVVSGTLAAVDWQNSTLLTGDVAEAVRGLKDRYGQIHTSGSAGLVQTLLRADLVDRLHLWLYPVVLGTGKRLFAEGAVPAAYRLTGARPFATGAVMLGYERAGAPAYGNLARDPEADGN